MCIRDRLRVDMSGSSSSSNNNPYSGIFGRSNIGAAGPGGSWDPDEGWRAHPDPLQDWYDAPTGSAQKANLPQEYSMTPRVNQVLTAAQAPPLSRVVSLVQKNMGNEPHGNLIESLMKTTATDANMPKQKEGRPDPFDKKDGKKSRQGKSLDDEYEDLMKDVAAKQPKTIPKVPEAKKDVPTEKVKPNKLFEKKKGPKTNEKTGRAEHGTEMDNSTDLKHWKKKGIGYLKDQLEKRGYKLPTYKLRGKGCLLYTSPSPRDATLSRMPSSA